MSPMPPLPSKNGRFLLFACLPLAETFTTVVMINKIIAVVISAASSILTSIKPSIETERMRLASIFIKVKEFEDKTIPAMRKIALSDGVDDIVSKLH